MGGGWRDPEPMSYLAIPDLTAVVDIQAGVVVSKVIDRDEIVNVTMWIAPRI